MRGIIHAGVALAAVLSVAACQRTDTAGPATSPAVETAPATAAGDAAASPAGTAGADDTPRARATAAMRDGRMYTPAGDSAIDHWLAARAQSPDDDAIASAIVELQPYLLIACEQAIANGRFDEARRLLSLMGRSTPTAPALPRLDRAIAAGEAEALALAANEARAEEETKARVVAAAEQAKAEAALEDTTTAPEIAAPASSAPVPEQAPRTEVAARTTPLRQPRPSPPPSPAEPPPTPAREAADPVLVHAAAPRYPMIAMHRGVEGSVEVAFTVQTDGSVANARVRSARPEGVFDNAALDAVAEYRFQPGREKHDIVQTIHFRLPDRG